MPGTPTNSLSRSATAVLRERPDSGKGSGTAAAIRAAAILLFAERGYTVTTMKAIAREVGIGPSAIYNHVDSKQTLLRDIVKGTIQRLIDDANRAIEATDDAAEQLWSAVHGHVAYHAVHRLETFIGNRELSHLEARSRTRQIAFREEYVGLFERLIERGIALRRFSAPAPKIAAFAIMQMGIGVSVWYREDGPLTPNELGDLYAGFALRMVQASV